jgi:hypothetical protein
MLTAQNRAQLEATAGVMGAGVSRLGTPALARRRNLPRSERATSSSIRRAAAGAARHGVPVLKVEA